MLSRVRIPCAVAAAALFAACSGNSNKSGNQPTPLKVTVDPVSAPADGASKVTVTVAGSTKGPVTISTTRGYFSLDALGKPVKSTSLPGNGSATLDSCDSRKDATCAGTASVRASDGNLATGGASVVFMGMEICDNGVDDNGDGKIDCADPQCAAGTACNAFGSVCTSGACTCPTGATEICNDGVDNNCDGKADCADAACDGQQCISTGGGVGTCQSGACVCAGGQATETTCNDGLDNDCDGKIDCADSDCNNKTCSFTQSDGSKVDGVCSGGVCTCKKTESTETSCGDGLDNDCNGLIDCADPACANAGCRANGFTCDASKQCSCSGNGGTPQATETNCSDNADNDCNGLVDCADSACANQTCGPNGLKCDASKKCSCPGGAATESSGTYTCGDGIDNDCNGLVDCADPACMATSVGTYGKSCDVLGKPYGKQCDWMGNCVCPSGHSSEVSCNDAKDNDCDGLIDCMDPDCQPGGVSATQPCDATGHTCAATANNLGSYCYLCPGGVSQENLAPPSPSGVPACGDGKDNDCDGLIDCADSDCNGQQCGPNTSQTCQNGKCVDSTTAYTVTVAPARAAIPADGVATDLITVTLTNSAAGSVAGQNITLSITGVGTWQGSGLQTLTTSTNANGVANATLLSDANGGIANITATLVVGGSNVTSGATSVSMPTAQSAKVVSIQYLVMGAKFSGYQEQNQIVFEVMDPTGNPYPAGLTVTFSHSPQGGSTIGPPPVTPCSTPGCTVTTTGVTDAQGHATVTLYSGTAFGPVAVSIKAVAGGNAANPAVATAQGITVVGAKASGSNIVVTCTPLNIPAYASTDCVNSLVNSQVTCTAQLSDRFNNLLGVATGVTLKSEAGAAGPSVATTPFDPTKPGDPNLGKATTFINTQGILPLDVPPNSAEPYSYTQNFGDGCGARTRNPRDGVVSVIVMAQGEEGFIDVNGNGTYDQGEPFIDLGEPFVDANDNGVWDSGEYFKDLNGNGVWDGPNGVWDANTTIWTETRVVWSGTAAVWPTSYTGTEYYSRFWDPNVAGTPPGPTSDPFYVVWKGPPEHDAYWGLAFMDQNFSPLASSAAYSVAKVGTGGESIALVSTFTPQNEKGFDFSIQYCDEANPATCGSACPPATGVTKCIIKTALQNFSYGRAATALITPASTAPEFNEIVSGTASVAGVNTTVYGYGETCALAGTTASGGACTTDCDCQSEFCVSSTSTCF